MHSLRSQLIISHLLPVLIVIPLIGIGLDTLLETRVIPAGDLPLLAVRYSIIEVAFVGWVVGIILSWSLALRLGNPIHNTAQAVFQIAQEDLHQTLPEAGPEEIQQLTKAVNTLVGRTQVLEKSRKQLLANLVHELGRPLGALRAATHALQSGAAEEPELRRELLVGMDDELRRLQRLLEDLAHLNDKSLGELELKSQPTQLGDWLAKLLSPWKEAALDKHLHWEVNLSEQLPAIEIDPDRLAQAVGNLISNAIRYTPTGGKITITADDNDQGVYIRVSDTGPGILPGEKEKIFTPFFRGNQQNRFPQGMGLGLSIARDIVVAHGGRIDLSSAQGLGSQFTIWLPPKVGRSG